MQFCTLNNIKTKDVLKISIPMMVSALSAHFMLILDQLILANYSIDAMVGATAASLWGAVIQCAAMSTTMIAGVFTGHYNGAKKYRLAGIPVWQMIWFSFGLFAISIPIAFLGGEYCIPENLREGGMPFFKIIMSFSPLVGIIFSMSSFFVAIGRGLLVTVAVIIANIVNGLIAVVLVFGYFGLDMFAGSVGAAIGTVSAWIVDIAILSFFFFKKDMRKKYGTINFKLRFSYLKRCLKLGGAAGAGHIAEMITWSFLYYLLATLGKDIALIQSMAVSVNLVYSFFISGIGNGVMYITANLIGAGLKEKTKTIMRKGLSIHFVFTGILFFIFFFFPEIVSDRFIKFEVPQETLDKAFQILKLIWVFFLFDGTCWIIAGVIEGGGDLNFTMWTLTLGLWIFVVLPSFFLYKFDYLTVELTWWLLIVAFIFISSVLYYRYRSGKWTSIRV